MTDDTADADYDEGIDYDQAFEDFLDDEYGDDEDGVDLDDVGDSDNDEEEV